MANPNKKLRKPKSSRARQRRLAQSQKSQLDFQTLEPRNLLASVVVSSASDLVSPTADTTSIAGLIANDGGDGISLREAITASNNTAGEDTITFDGSVFTGGDDNLIRLTQDQLGITESLIIDATSAGGVLITGDTNGDDVTLPGTRITDVTAGSAIGGQPIGLLSDNQQRVLEFSDSTGNLTLTGLTITGGASAGGPNGSGGGVRFVGTLTLNQSNISGNSVTGNYGYGGGIHTRSGDVFLSNSIVSGNRTDGEFGGGGGIFNFNGDVSLVNSTVSGNFVVGDFSQGGGILDVFGDVKLVNSTVSGNSTDGIFGIGGGIYSGGDVFLNNSTVSGNRTLGSRSGGGGINGVGETVSLVNSTVSGNSTGTDSDGGGIDTGPTAVILVNSTVTENTSGRRAGGIQLDLSGELTLRNSIVAGNVDNGAAPDLQIPTTVGPIVEHSLIGDTTGSTITAATGAGNILNQAAQLGPLAGNGGATETHVLLPGSPAINAGNNALAVDENGIPLTTDQRGEVRIESGTVDIGAVEFESGNPFLLGDANQNGVVNILDIQPFISLLSTNSYLDEADIDRDGDVDFLDIAPFISLLGSTGTTATPQPVIAESGIAESGAEFSIAQPVISQPLVVASGESQPVGAQANFDVFDADLNQSVSSTETNSQVAPSADSILELQGAHELIDGIFSETVDSREGQVADDTDQTRVDVLNESWPLL